MKQWIGLIKMEHKHNALMYSVLALISLACIMALPYGLKYMFADIEIESTRFTLTLPLAIFNFFTFVSFFIGSIRRELNVKDIWLHNTSSIYTLISAKLVYNFVGLVIAEACVFVGFFFVGDALQGTFLQYSFFAFCGLWITLFFYAAAVTIALFFYVLYLQVARSIGKLALIVVAAGFFALLELLNSMPSTTIFKHIAIDLAGLEKYMPTFSGGTDISIFFEKIYIVEDLIVWTILIAVFMSACKWLERVLTR